MVPGALDAVSLKCKYWETEEVLVIYVTLAFIVACEAPIFTRRGLRTEKAFVTQQFFPLKTNQEFRQSKLHCDGNLS